MNPFAILLGRNIYGISVSEGEATLRFDVGFKKDQEYIYITTDGDCCSETWFADIIGVANLLSPDTSAYRGYNDDGKIMGIELLDLPPEDNSPRTRQEYDTLYGIRLRTKKGDCDIIYRNSSNGYYGGEAFPMRVEDGQKIKNWKEITEDWQA